MRRLSLTLISVFLLLGLTGCSFKVTRPMLQMALSGTNRISTEPAYADSLEKKLSVPYVDNGTGEQVLDIYYADPDVRKDAVLIDIHGGFYVAGKRENNRDFASVFLREGYDVVLLEYRLNNGTTDVSDELADCAAALDYLTIHSKDLNLNRKRMFLTGDSLGRKIEFIDIESPDRRVGHVHNVTNLDLPESQDVNSRMIGFLNRNLH